MSLHSSDFLNFFRTAIKDEVRGPNKAEANTPNLLDCDSFKQFWLTCSWDNNMYVSICAIIRTEVRYTYIHLWIPVSLKSNLKQSSLQLGHFSKIPNLHSLAYHIFEGVNLMKRVHLEANLLPLHIYIEWKWSLLLFVTLLPCTIP